MAPSDETLFLTMLQSKFLTQLLTQLPNVIVVMKTAEDIGYCFKNVRSNFVTAADICMMKNFEKVEESCTIFKCYSVITKE